MTEQIRCLTVYDREIDLFEGQYPVPEGITYNSYVVLDEKTAVLDTMDKNYTEEWMSQLSAALNGRTPDYLIVQHMEPDHSAGIALFMERFPKATIAASAQAFRMMANFFGTDYADRRMVIAEGDTLSLGSHTLRFIAAPMVHWPEVMMTYETSEKVLFSADGFGRFGSPDPSGEWDAQARRYYIGIVGKFGAQVQKLLQKAAALDIAVICPLHGPMLENGLDHAIGLYNTWSSYAPEETGVLVAYASVYGGTEKAAKRMGDILKERGQTVQLMDLNRCDRSEAIAQAFRYDRLVLCSITYNGGIFPSMEHFLRGLTERGFQKRTVACIENGSWAPMAAKVMKGILADCRELTFCEPIVTLRSVYGEKDEEALSQLADALM